MSRKCSVCIHEACDDIDRALASGVQHVALSKRYGLSKFALSRHAAKHLPEAIAKAQGAVEVAKGDDLLSIITECRDVSRRVMQTAERSKEKRVTLASVRELLRVAELLAKVSGQLQDNATVNVIVSPQWVQIRGVILDSLQPFPDAREAVAAALLTVGEET
jgi:hypothetical protein